MTGCTRMSASFLFNAAILLVISLVAANKQSSDAGSDDLGMTVEFKAQDLMSPVLYKILKSSDQGFFADGKVKGTMRANNFKFEPGLPSFREPTQTVPPPTLTGLVTRPTTPWRFTSPPRISGSVIGNAPLPVGYHTPPPHKRASLETEQRKRSESEDGVKSNLVELLKRLLSIES